ncbi:glutaminyl-peptide cyclotransferase [Thalassoroseus pseudoceratinae]|uniref:glutaminyl-peptide cyclotransferase n=1 Tax=Thalassoroseus pseudoceratinae TaxID=2713176 RepID=UPI00197CC97C|nr:glutaminyl-peptide cyclotransferase [Thalassoroseus pseudoceratinae]
MENAITASESSASPTPDDVANIGTTTKRRWIILAASLLLVGGGIFTAWAMGLGSGTAPVVGYRIVNEFPHDANAFTQGLVITDGVLLEGTGQYGQSSLREVDLKSGRVLRQQPLSPRVFGEGITVMGDRIYQLTWKSGICFVYDAKTLQPVDRFRYRGQGWGITHDGTHLILSDGGYNLEFIDPKTFKTIRRIRVIDGRRRIDNLNELEYINGEIWANIWHSDYIARIDPKTGTVNSWVNLTGLHPRRPHREAVLNGIAWDEQSKRLFVTGKNWGKLFEVVTVSTR